MRQASEFSKKIEQAIPEIPKRGVGDYEVKGVGDISPFIVDSSPLGSKFMHAEIAREWVCVDN